MTSQLLIFRGPPGSGKSTARDQFSGYTVVSRDDLRFSMFGKYHGVDEQVVTDVENAMVESALRAGQDVLLDATNLRNKFLTAKLSLASRYGAEVVFLDFPIPMSEAIARDAARERTVGRRVIERFYKEYRINTETGQMKPPPAVFPEFEEYVRDESLPTAYIIDTDGTVANHEPHRGPYDHSKYHLDTVHTHVAEAVNAIASQHFIIALSGRDEKFRDVTVQWWQDNGIQFDKFYMRPEGDTRTDAIIKYELFRSNIEPEYNVLGAFDDRPQVIRMWRKIGLPVFDVGYGVEF